MSGEGLRLAGDDGSGDPSDWELWGSEMRTGERRLFVAQPVGSRALMARTPGLAAGFRDDRIMPRKPFGPVDIGRLTLPDVSS